MCGVRRTTSAVSLSLNTRLTCARARARTLRYRPVQRAAGPASCLDVAAERASHTLVCAATSRRHAKIPNAVCPQMSTEERASPDALLHVAHSTKLEPS
ncbi:unnamed protein product [Mesocestoides corti]|uniref:Uncharacterized protein n=1 Tax=Mesocestoides corti TaxID=53468 RepID=A0A0R3U2C3_MESCO|nr:unnamed protein product [Mesocestoides corti]